MSWMRRLSRGLVILLGTLLLAGSLGSAWRLHAHAASGEPAEPANEAPPRVVCFGHVDVEPGVANLYPAQPGRVEQVPVQENQAVRAGDVLLRLDRRQAECLVRLARADLTAAEVQRDQARLLREQQKMKELEQQAVVEAVGYRLQAAEWSLARREELRGLQVSDKEIEAARSQCGEARATQRGEEQKLAELRLNDPELALKRAEADVVSKQARLDQAQLALDECDLKAPADGTVLRVLVSAGDLLGAQPRQPAIVFCPQGPRIVRAEVEQEFAARVALGQVAVIEDDATAAGRWQGRIVRLSDWYAHRRSILQDPLQLNDVRTLECVLVLDAGQSSLRIGQRVRVILGSPAP